MLPAPQRRTRKPLSKAGLRLELLLLSEEHGEADDGAVDEQTADNAHDHSLNTNLLGVRQHYGKSCEIGISTHCPRLECASNGSDVQTYPFP